MCVQDHEFEKLVEVMGNPDWAEMELFENRFSRADYVDVLKNFLVEWSMQYTKKEIFKIAQEGRVPLAPAYTSEEVVNSEHMVAREYFVVVDHPEIGKAKYPGAPYAFSQTPWKIDRHAPLLGEHNKEIFQGRFGYSDEKLAELRETGVI
jgi:crotonobetainyl-CoA:carnitine CoA-transferase CaiB-like acyl-CoA transferase